MKTIQWQFVIRQAAAWSILSILAVLVWATVLYMHRGNAVAALEFLLGVVVTVIAMLTAVHLVVWAVEEAWGGVEGKNR